MSLNPVVYSHGRSFMFSCSLLLWEELVYAINEAISRLPLCNAQEFHRGIKEMYNWNDVAERTEKVYVHSIYMSTN